MLGVVLSSELAPAAELKILAHPRSVRLVLEGIAPTTAALEQEGLVARVRLDPPVEVTVPPVPAAARARLIAVESRDQGGLLVLALEARTKARLASSHPARIVLDLDESEEEPLSSATPRTARAAPTTGASAPPLRVRSGRHPGFLRIVAEGAAVAALTVQPRDRDVLVTGPAEALELLATHLENLGPPISSARVDGDGLAIVLEPNAEAARRVARSDQLVLDISKPPRRNSSPPRPPSAPTGASDRPSPERTQKAQTAARPRAQARAPGSAAGGADERPCRPVREGQLCLLAESDPSGTRLVLVSTPRPRAAAFALGETLWIVLDRPLALVATGSATSDTALGSVVRAERLSDASVLAITLPRALVPRLEPIEDGWQLLLTGEPEPRTDRLLPKPSQDGASLFLPVDGRPIQLPAQLVGSDLWVVPTREVSGLSASLRVPDLEFLPSHQGYVVRPKVGDLWLRREDGGVRIGRASGLRLAEGALRARRLPQQGSPPRGEPAIGGETGQKPELRTGPVAAKAAQFTASAVPPSEPRRRDALVATPVSADGRPVAVSASAPPPGEGAIILAGEPSASGSAHRALSSPSAVSSPGEAAEVAPREEPSGGAQTGSSSSTAASSQAERLAGKVEAAPSRGARTEANGSGRAEEGAAGRTPESAMASDSSVGLAEPPARADSSASEPDVSRGSEPLLGLLDLASLSDPELAARRTKLLEQRARASGDARDALNRELARLALAGGQAREALAFLDDPPAATYLDADPPGHPTTRALAGAAAVLAGRSEAGERLLADPRFEDDPEVALFRAVAAAVRSDWPRAGTLLAGSARLFTNLPPALQRRLAEPLARIHLEAGRTSAVLAVVDRVSRLDPDPRERQRLHHLQALALHREGALAQAEQRFAEAASGPDRLIAIEARFRAAMARFERGAATLLETLHQLEQDRLMWRQHPAEAEMLDRLFALEHEAGRLEAALATACARLTRHAHAHGAEGLLARARELLLAGLSQAEPRLDPLSALATVRDCPQLVGADPLGARAAKALAERLAAIGLSRVAADLLVERAARAEEGSARGELVLEAVLAMHAAGRTEAALALLERERASLASRSDLAARAEQLRAALGGSHNVQATVLRAQLAQARSAGDWRAVASAAEQLLRLPLATTERRSVALELVAALAALAERDKLRAAAETFAAEFEGTRESHFFSLLASQASKATESVPAALQRELAALRATLAAAP